MNAATKAANVTNAKYSPENVATAVAALRGSLGAAAAAGWAAAALLAAVGLGGVRHAHAQEPPAAEQPPAAPAEEPAAETLTETLTEEQRKARLETALKELDETAARFDEDTKKLLPAFRAILTRYYLDRESMTAAETDIAKTLRARIRSRRAVDLDALDNSFRQKLKANTALSGKPSIKTGAHRVPGAKEPVGFVSVAMNGREKVIAEIPNAAGGMTPTERAQKVARRLITASAADPLWWSRATVGQKKGAFVVAAPTAPDGYVITADTDYARLRGVAPSRLAMALTSDIRTVFGGPTSRDIERRERTPEEAAALAADLRTQGDAAYSAGKMADAEAKYREAIRADKTYAVAYERLAALYADQGKAAAAKRRAVAREALALPNLDADQKKTLAKMAK